MRSGTLPLLPAQKRRSDRKDAFMASFFHEGVLGGAIYLQKDKAIYRTNKLQVEPQYRNLEMPYYNLEEIEIGWVLCFPTVILSMKSGVSYKFILWNRKKFLPRLDELKNGVLF